MKVWYLHVQGKREAGVTWSLLTPEATMCKAAVTDRYLLGTTQLPWALGGGRGVRHLEKNQHMWLMRLGSRSKV